MRRFKAYGHGFLSSILAVVIWFLLDKYMAQLMHFAVSTDYFNVFICTLGGYIICYESRCSDAQHS